MGNFVFKQTGEQMQCDFDVIEKLISKFNSENIYPVDSIIIHEDKIYRCHTAVENPGNWTGVENWEETDLQSLLNLKENEIQEIENQLQNFVDLTSEQTITGQKSFNIVYFGGNEFSRPGSIPAFFNVTGDNKFVISLTKGIKFDAPVGAYNINLYGGKVTLAKFANSMVFDLDGVDVLRLKKSSFGTSLNIPASLNDGNSNYLLSLPDSTSWTTDKVIATTDQCGTKFFVHSIILDGGAGDKYIDIVTIDPTPLKGETTKQTFLNIDSIFTDPATLGGRAHNVDGNDDQISISMIKYYHKEGVLWVFGSEDESFSDTISIDDITEEIYKI